MKTNDDLILDNMNLAYDLAWKYYNKFNRRFELEEIQSTALLGLTKAAKTYNSNLGFTFSTYAYKVMLNEFLLYLRSNTKHINILSISQPLFDDITLEDSLASDIDIEENLNDNEYSQKLYLEINKLNDKYKTVLLYKLKGYTQQQIAEKENVNVQDINKLYNKAINLLRIKFKDWRW